MPLPLNSFGLIDQAAPTAAPAAIPANSLIPLTNALLLSILFPASARLWNSSESLIFGNGVGDTSFPRKAQSGSHPSFTLNTSNFSSGTKLCTYLLCARYSCPPLVGN